MSKSAKMILYPCVGYFILWLSMKFGFIVLITFILTCVIFGLFE